MARNGGLREAARASGASAFGYSEAVNRLEARLGVRLLNGTTLSVAPTEAVARLLIGSLRRWVKSKRRCM